MNDSKFGALGAVGHAAQASKKAISQPQDLVSFSVKKGDNGGVLVCETYETKAPAGRRASSYMGGGDYKENPFSPDDGAAATSHITGLLSQMGVASAPDTGGSDAVPPGPTLPQARSLSAVRGPNAGAIGASGPRGSVGLMGGDTEY